MFGKLNTILRGDRGESSITLIISQFVSLLVAAALAGLVFILVTGGAKIQAENAAQTELQIANRAFVTDVDNASKILITDESRIVLSSTKFLKNASGQFVCRASSWYFAPASAEIEKERGNDALYSLYNDITVYASSDCASAVTSQQTRVAITAVQDSATFRYTNIAGINLQFSNGVVTNFRNVVFDETTKTYNQIAAAQFRIDNNVNTWYTDAEMYRELPKVIEARMVAVFPVTASNTATFKATTNEAETELVGNNNGVIDPGGEQTRWIPNAVSNIWIKRSQTTGAYVGGVREGINITWAARPATDCAPGSTIKYNWLVTNIRTNNQSSGETIGINNTTVDVMTNTGGKAEIWNGGNYKVQVVARCNDVDGQSPDKSATFTLSMPNVINVLVTANSPQTRHTVTYSKASSDPTTVYTVQHSPANVAQAGQYTRETISMITGYESGASNGTYPTTVWRYPNMPWNNAGTSSTTAFVKDPNTVVGGNVDSYQVRASSADSANTTGIWTPANLIYKNTITNAPPVTVIDETHFEWTPPTCTAGSTYEYRGAATNAIGSSGNPPTDGTLALINSAPIQSTRTIAYPTILEGSRVFVRVEARCTSKFTLNPTNNQVTDTLQPWSPDGTTSFHRNVTPPNQPKIGFVSSGWGMGTEAITNWGAPDERIIDGVSGVCAPGTNLAYYQHYYEGEINNTGYTTALSRSVNHVAQSGTLYSWGVKARCESYADGYQDAQESGFATNGYYTVVPGPEVHASASGSYVLVGTDVFIGGGTSNCNFGNGANSLAWTEGPRWVSRSYPTGANFSNSAYCVGANGRTSGVGTSGNVYVQWYEPAPDPVGGLGGRYVMTCTQTGSGGGFARDGFSGSASWSASNYATSYTVYIDYTTKTGGRATMSAVLSGTYMTFQAASSASNANVTVKVIASGAGGSSSASSVTLTTGGCL